MDTSGHGQFTVRDEFRKQHHLYAHRIAWALDGRNIGPNLKLLHACDNGPCVRVSHLFVGTQQENLEDARNKGRLLDGAHKVKLSDEALAEIRDTYRARKNGYELAAKYGVTITTILRVIAGTARVIPRHLRNIEPVASIEMVVYDLPNWLAEPPARQSQVRH